MTRDSSVSVMVVDDDPVMLKVWARILRDGPYDVTTFNDPLDADSQLDAVRPDVAIVDLQMPGMDGMELLSRIKARRPETEVLIMTGYGGVDAAVEAVKRGAYDFLAKPLNAPAAAELAVRRAAELQRLERRVQQLVGEGVGETIVGRSAALRAVLDQVRSIAASPANVLICGESGTGKELIARTVHENSRRARARLVPLNCSALPEPLLESELFGYVKGAFTGAVREHQGLFAAANGGTIFLDEIGDLALPTQAKLLRTLQEGEVRRVGSNETEMVDVRVIAATNLDLERRCREGLFREDLYFRLNVIRFDVPPLRERGDDVALLARHFLVKHQSRVERRFHGIAASAITALGRYHWPGNVRELENVIERAVAVARGKLITVADLPPQLTREREASTELTELPFAEAKEQAIKRFERQYIQQLLRRHPTVAAAARAAGVDRSNFRRLLKRHQLTTGR